MLLAYVIRARGRGVQKAMKIILQQPVGTGTLDWASQKQLTSTPPTTEGVEKATELLCSRWGSTSYWSYLSGNICVGWAFQLCWLGLQVKWCWVGVILGSRGYPQSAEDSECVLARWGLMWYVEPNFQIPDLKGDRSVPGLCELREPTMRSLLGVWSRPV